MVAGFALITGVLAILIIGALALAGVGMAHLLPSLVPLAPWLVMAGTFLLILTELLLFLGGKDDRRAALKDLSILVPTCLISGGLWYLAQKLLW